MIPTTSRNLSRVCQVVLGIFKKWNQKYNKNHKERITTKNCLRFSQNRIPAHQLANFSSCIHFAVLIVSVLLFFFIRRIDSCYWMTHNDRWKYYIHICTIRKCSFMNWHNCKSFSRQSSLYKKLFPPWHFKCLVTCLGVIQTEWVTATIS